MIVALEDLTLGYGDQRVLTGLSVRLHARACALVGVNGAGKTTLLTCLSTGLRPRGGRVLFDGAEYPAARTGELRALRRRVALAPQRFSPPTQITALELLAYLAWARGVPRSERRQRASEVLDQVGLADRASQRIGHLSGGMQRRLNLAQALLARPALLLLDEPFAGLDPEQRVRLRELVATLAGAETTVVLSSHELADVGEVAEQVVMLDGGRVAFSGSTSEMEARGRALIGAGNPVSALEAGFLSLRGGSSC